MKEFTNQSYIMANNKYKLIEYIKINHWYMTLSEMATELNLAHSTIMYECDLLGIKPITVRERVIEFIKDNQDLTIEDIADRLGMSVSSMYPYLKDLGIKLKTRGQVEPQNAALQEKIRTETKQAPIVHLSDEAMDYLNGLTGYRLPEKQPIKRVREPFTQTGSQFTDELRGIETTKRVEVSARDAKIE